MQRRSLRRTTTAVTVAGSILVGCAAPQGAGPFDREAQPIQMSAANQGRNPCEEASRREQAFGQAIVGGLIGTAAGAIAGNIFDNLLVLLCQ